jgi:O-antigen/teichoic acid export membrane protein
MKSQERFCSKCGTDSFAERGQTSVQARTNWDTHVKVLATLFIVSALFMAIPALGLLLFPGMMLTGMAHRPFHFAGPFFTTIALAFISIPVVNVITGIGLLRYREWARVLALVLAAFMLIGFPFGTGMGIYAFWVLLSNEGSASYKRGNLSAEGRGWPSREGAPG